jgi:hypothetical protein
MKSTIERIALNYSLNTRPIHSPAKRQNIARLRTNHEMLVVDSAFHATRLVRPFEMAANHCPLLLKLEVL